MFGSNILEIVVGIIFVYLMLSLLVTSINESLVNFLGWRAKNFKLTIERMLDDNNTPCFSKLFYQHSMIKYMYSSRNPEKDITSLSSDNFAKVIVDILITQSSKDTKDLQKKIGEKNFEFILEYLRMRQNSSEKNPYDQLIPKIEESNSKNIQEIIIKSLESESEECIRKIIIEALKKDENILSDKIIEGIKGKEFQDVIIKIIEEAKKQIIDNEEKLIANSNTNKVEKLLKTSTSNGDTEALLYSLFLESGSNLEIFKEKLKLWYDEMMSQASGWYKRRMRWLTFSVGIVIVLLFNANTFNIVDKLATDTKSLQNMLALAEKLDKNKGVENPTNAEGIKKSIEDNLIQTTQTLGMGWNLKLFDAFKSPRDLGGILWKVLIGFKWLLGWAITVFAITLGAPFWFDLLSKVMNLRSKLDMVKKAEEAGRTIKVVG